MKSKTFNFSIAILTIMLLIFTTSTILINIPNASADGGGGGVCWDGCERFGGFLICCMWYWGWDTCYTPAPDECVLEDFGCMEIET